MTDVYREELAQMEIGRKVAETFAVKFEEQLNRKMEFIINGYQRSEKQLTSSLRLALNKLKNIYSLRMKTGEADEIQSIYVSFLRSAVILDEPVYRLDGYDHRGRLSPVECSVRWECAEIEKLYHTSVKELQNLFNTQTKLRKYVFDQRKMLMARQIDEAVRPLIIQAVDRVKQERIWQTADLEYYIGDYLDKAERI